MIVITAPIVMVINDYRAIKDILTFMNNLYLRI